MNQRITGKYVYRDAFGNVAYWKVRLEPGRKSTKEFRFYHGNNELGRGGEPILYNLPSVIAAKSVIFTEGEKQSDILTQWGLCGTTFDSGSNSKFPAEMVEYLKGKRVAVLRDNDDPGTVYAEMICRMLHGVCEISKIVLLPNLPLKGDICDWDGNLYDLLSIIRAEPEYAHVEPAKKPVNKVRRDVVDMSGDLVERAKAVPVDSLLEFQGGYARCLWHEEENPSLHHHKQMNRVKCFSCGAGGSSIDVVMKRDGIGFKAAVRALQW
jgi:hypothetical protein